MQVIRTWAETEALDPPLTQAELALRAACDRGEPCTLGDGALPPEGDPPAERAVRAALLRYFILGGCADRPVLGPGLYLEGAYISGALDLSYMTAHGAITCADCMFADALHIEQATFEALTLSGSRLPALSGEGVIVKGNLILRDTVITGKAQLLGAQIGRQLVLERTKLLAATGNALVLESARIANELVWKDVRLPKGNLSLADTKVGGLMDDLDAWPSGERCYFDGLVYDRITASDLDPETRIEWVKKGAYWNGEFFPQPFTQLAKVYRATGHDADARKVLSRREHLLRKHERERMGPVARRVQAGIDWLLRRVIGYGHHPFRSLWTLLILIVLTTGLAEWAWRAGDMAPNAAPILVSEGWQRMAAAPKVHLPNPAAEWSKAVPGKDWETFFSLAYAADVVIPIINFGQTEAWAPSTERSPVGGVLWWWRWLASLAGWIATALGAAAITGYVSRD